jgi:hypothetical protein
MQIIRWENPPPPQNGRVSGGRPRGSRWDEVARQLRDEPRRWAVIFEGSRIAAFSVVSSVRQASTSCFGPAGSFEARSRSFDGVHSVYARFLGDGGPW